MRLTELLNGLSYTCSGNPDVKIRNVIYDSRKVTPGCAFVCLCGSSVDGHDYAQQAANSGAAAVIVQRDVPIHGPIVVKVENTRRALAVMSAAYFRHPADEIRVIGVTGTKGKTTTSYMIRSILESAGIKTGLIGTIGTVIGDQIIQTNNTTPESYDVQRYLRMMADSGCGAAVIEASSIGLKDDRVSGFTFDIGLFTNFSPDHIGGSEHKSLEEYMQCKSLLFRQCRIGVINIDDENWKGITQGHTCEIETYGFRPEAGLRAGNESLISRPGYLGVHFDVSGRLSFGVDVDIPGRFSVYNALAAVAVCRHFPVEEKDYRNGLNTVKVKGRVESVPVPGNYTLLIDYAHNALSMENILETLREYRPHRLVCMFGAGGNRARSRRFEMGEVSGRMADLSVITADNSRFEDVMDIIEDIKVGIDKTSGKYVVIPDRKEAIRYCMEHAEDGDIVVLAGKGHEDYQEIKGIKYHFDEREVVADIIKSMSGEKK
ncbi:MAG: UDP-N-acetylmuramoyl-L-alanyl-D-glutamate--2,6-diaminopimelate ligase [Clostridiales bacterium]|nr:UDP-N-acetylmuramoyl-L-alanyl-D-glutamate--2,6-diaminopimelate ligase [Clostridiales bacterium]